MSEVCKGYGISDLALKKTCKKLRVATPPRGYWAKKASGKEPPKLKLIPFENPPRVIIRKTTSQGNDSTDEEHNLAPEAFVEAERLIQSLQIVQVSEDLDDLHPYVRNTRKIFKRQLKKHYYEYIATGILKLEIDKNSYMMKGQKTWTGGKTKSIESRIYEIIHQLIYAAAWNKESAAYHNKREEE